MLETEAISGTSASRPQIPAMLNAFLVGIMMALQVWLWFVLPLVLLPLDARWGWTVLPVVLATTTLWSLLHEAFHDNLLADRRLNAAAGRLLAISIGASFRVLRFGHIMHHRFNRTVLDRADIVSAAERRRPGTWVAYYFRLTIGLFLLEMAGSWASLLPRPAVARVVARLFGAQDEAGRSMHGPAERTLLSPGALREIRLDAAAAIVLTGTGLFLYGDHWPLLAAALLARGFLISFFDNAYHYGTPGDDILSARNLSLPRWAERAILNFNLHGIHHRAPAIPWPMLAPEFRKNRNTYDSGYFSSALRQLGGPVPDPASVSLRKGI